MHFVILTIGATISYIISRNARDNYGDDINAGALAKLILFQLVFYGFILALAASVRRGAQSDTSLAIGFALFMAMWMPALFITASLAGSFLTRSVWGFKNASNPNAPVRKHLGAVRTYLWDEDPARALEACIEEFDAHPKEADILLDGANLFLSHGLYAEAVQLLEKAAHVFADDTTLWAAAAYQLALVLLTRLHQPERAQALLERIVKRTPGSQIGTAAAACLRGETPVLNWVETHARCANEQDCAADPFLPKKTNAPKPPEPAPDKTANPDEQFARLADAMPGVFMDDPR